MVAPLDWGLGHATRCIPLIRSMLNAGCEVTLAGEKQTADILQQEFPTLECLHLKGYGVQYPKQGIFFMLSMAMQLPKILLAIRHERNWLRLQMSKRQNKWDTIISDNRYGLHHAETTNVIITHQLGVISGMGKFIDLGISMNIHRWLNHFQQVWIPDCSGKMNLSGKLSRPKVLPKQVKFIGPLSRLDPITSKTEYVLVLLSGPEPQRSILEEKLIRALPQLKDKVLFVRGLPAEAGKMPDSEGIEFLNYLPSTALTQVMAKAKFVICRSGYSSIMDLVRMNKKAILIPTPGQTEQVYLANHLHAKGWFLTLTQDRLDLYDAAQKISQSKGPDSSIDFSAYEKALSSIGIQ